MLALSFPLHPPGKPEKSRAEELLGVREAGLEMCVVQGARDPFGRPEEFPDWTAVVPVPWADHGFAVPGKADLSQEEALAHLTHTVREWLANHVG